MFVTDCFVNFLHVKNACLNCVIQLFASRMWRFLHAKKRWSQAPRASFAA